MYGKILTSYFFCIKKTPTKVDAFKIQYSILDLPQSTKLDIGFPVPSDILLSVDNRMSLA